MSIPPDEKQIRYGVPDGLTTSGFIGTNEGFPLNAPERRSRGIGNLTPHDTKKYASRLSGR